MPTIDKLLLVAAAAVVVFVANVQVRADHTEAKKFTNFGVVPDVIDAVPRKLLKIEYASGAKLKEGNELTPTVVKDRPNKISFSEESDSLYTLVFLDADVPSRNDSARHEILHWLVVNIPGKKVLEKGVEHVGYIGSGPPQGSGLHRYVMLVYKQPGQLTLTEPKITATQFGWRPMFNVRNFAKKYNLGQPVAANFYRAMYDSYVPTLHAQFTDLPRGK